MNEELGHDEYLILGLLREQSELYGLDLSRRSNGELQRGIIYITLAAMEVKGYISSRVGKVEYRIERRVYTITEAGIRMHNLKHPD